MIRAAFVAPTSIVAVSQEGPSQTTRGRETPQDTRTVDSGLRPEPAAHLDDRPSSHLWRDYRVHVVLAVMVGLVQTCSSWHWCSSAGVVTAPSMRPSVIWKTRRIWIGVRPSES